MSCTHSTPCEYNPWSAVIENHLDCLKKIYQNSPEEFDEFKQEEDANDWQNSVNGFELIDSAIDNKHLDCAKWLCEIGIKPNEQCILRAIEINNPECLNTVLKYYDIDTNGFGYEWDDPVRYAIEFQYKDILEILINCGFEYEFNVNCNFSNNRDGLECFKYLYSRACSSGCIGKNFHNFESNLKYGVDDLEFVFDDIFWRNFFFEEDLTDYPLLNSFIIRKKQEFENLKTELQTVLVNKIPKDIIKYDIQQYI